MKHARSAARLMALALLTPLAAGCARDRAAAGIEALPPRWTAVAPGGETSCAYGDPFRFYVKPGKVDRLVVEFRGGGACWSQETCSRQDLFQATAEPDSFLLDEARAAGIYDHDHPENPVRDWHHVYIPYCTADVHWGDHVATYGQGKDAFTIHHKGAANVRAALAWIAENVRDPERILVAGCSAGAYGAIMWAPHVQRMFPEAQVTQLGDSGAGIITEGFFQESYPTWRSASAYPTWIPGVDPQQVTSLSSLYIAIGRHYPEMRLSQVTTIRDHDQVRFYRTMGGGGEEGGREEGGPAAEGWSREMLASIGAIEAALPNFHSYMAPGTRHCILPYDALYTLSVDGVPFAAWLEDLVTGEPVRSVRCPGCTAATGAP